MTAQEVESVWRSQLAGTGVEKPSRVGYSFGLAFVPDWGEHTVSLRPARYDRIERGDDHPFHAWNLARYVRFRVQRTVRCHFVGMRETYRVSAEIVYPVVYFREGSR